MSTYRVKLTRLMLAYVLAVAALTAWEGVEPQRAYTHMRLEPVGEYVAPPAGLLWMPVGS